MIKEAINKKDAYKKIATKMTVKYCMTIQTKRLYIAKNIVKDPNEYLRTKEAKKIQSYLD